MPTINADGTCVCGIAASDCDYHRPTTFEKRYGFTAEKWRAATQYVYRDTTPWPEHRIVYRQQLYCSPPKYNATVTF